MNEDELEIHEELMAYNPLASMVPYGRMELSEAEFQKNCAFSKIDQILAGQMLLFKVRRPIRGTLSLVNGSDGNWRIDEFRAAENKEVPQSMIFEMAAHLNLCVEREKKNEYETQQYAV